MKRKLKVRMRGAQLRAFTAGHMSDDEARAQGYDPVKVRAYHRILPPLGRLTLQHRSRTEIPQT